MGGRGSALLILVSMHSLWILGSINTTLIIFSDGKVWSKGGGGRGKLKGGSSEKAESTHKPEMIAEGDDDKETDSTSSTDQDKEKVPTET